VNAKCQASSQGAESAVEHKFISLLLRFPDDDDGSCPSRGLLLANSGYSGPLMGARKQKCLSNCFAPSVTFWHTKRRVYFTGDCS